MLIHSIAKNVLGTNKEARWPPQPGGFRLTPYPHHFSLLTLRGRGYVAGNGLPLICFLVGTGVLTFMGGMAASAVLET